MATNHRAALPYVFFIGEAQLATRNSHLFYTYKKCSFSEEAMCQHCQRNWSLRYARSMTDVKKQTVLAAQFSVAGTVLCRFTYSVGATISTGYMCQYLLLFVGSLLLRAIVPELSYK